MFVNYQTPDQAAKAMSSYQVMLLIISNLIYSIIYKVYNSMNEEIK